MESPINPEPPVLSFWSETFGSWAPVDQLGMGRVSKATSEVRSSWNQAWERHWYYRSMESRCYQSVGMVPLFPTILSILPCYMTGGTCRATARLMGA